MTLDHAAGFVLGLEIERRGRWWSTWTIEDEIASDGAQLQDSTESCADAIALSRESVRVVDMNDTNKTAARRTEILAALSTHDDGTGTLGIIVDQAMIDDPEVTVEEVAAIVREAEAEAVIEAE